MIDLYVEINTLRKGKKRPLPHQGISYLNGFLQNHKEIDRKDLYAVAYDFSEPDNFLFETEDKILIKMGYVFWRNGYKVRNNIKADSPSLKDIFRILEKGGSDFSEAIKGNFIFILYSRNANRVDIFNSPFGVIPFYYHVKGNKIVLSSNLTMILHQDPLGWEVDGQSLVEISVFDYILGGKTYIKDIFQLEYGETVEITHGVIQRKEYYDYFSLISEPPLSRKRSISSLMSVFRDNMELYMKNNKKTLLAITGGYDGRLNFAAVDKKYYSDLLIYTYGMAKSSQISIAREITDHFKLDYKPVILDRDYEEKYTELSKKAVQLSDGYAPFMRANYYYAHNELKDFSRECITGLFGSEFIRPMHVVKGGVSINFDTVDLFLSDDPESKLKDMFERKKGEYFHERFFTQDSLNKIMDYLEKCYFSVHREMPKRYKLYLFYLREGMRKFFMEELRIDRFFVDHKLVYLDVDFLEELFRSRYAGVYNGVFRENPVKRRKGQLLYVDIMDRLQPVLNEFKVDRGYRPKNLKTSVGWLRVMLGFIIFKLVRKRLVGNDTFNTKLWKSIVYKNSGPLLNESDEYFKDNFREKFEKGEHLSDEYVFARHFSIKMWLNHIEKYLNNKNGH